MKINFQDYDLEGFVIRECKIAGDECYLIFPQHIGVKWDKKNLIFRSSVWTKEGELISAGFKRFFNWSEQPDLAYTPFSLTANGGCELIEKKDGSTLIVSKHRGELIARTRGTVDASGMENGWEIEYLKEKYPLAFNHELLDGHSLIYEWTSPENVIVLNYGEVDISLIACIKHEDYSLFRQSELDKIALEIGVPRPAQYHYKSIKEMIGDVETWVNAEGICCYCNNGQDIRKLKSEWYLSAHKMKSEMGSIERVIDFWFANDMPDYQTAYQTLCDLFDFEIAEKCKGDLSRICDAWKEVKRIVDFMEKYVYDNSHKDQKTFALDTLQKWGDTNRASFVFSLRKGQELSKENYKKLLYQCLK